MHFCKMFEFKCVLEVCVHNHPIMIKIHLVLFFFLSQIEPSVCVTSQGRMTLPRLLIDSSIISTQTALVSYLRPALSEAVISFFTAGAHVDKNDS